jgi:class 3 adenylate cyclase
VLFCDLVGSTALGEQLDPEVLGELVRRYFERMSRALERHGATVEKFAGDAVMAVFGVPERNEDDALRALRAADEMRAELRRLNEELREEGGVPMQHRIGINTGEVVSGDARLGQGLVLGDAVNVAARFEQHAAPGEILLDPVTRELAGPEIRTEAVPPLVAKGKSRPLPAFRLLEVGAATDDAPVVARTPLVGRAQELDDLRRGVRRSFADGVSGWVLVRGPAGIGKSRLVGELLEALGPTRVVRGRCLPYGQPAAGPLGDVLRAVARIDRDDDPATIVGRITGVLGGDTRAATLAPHLAATAGLTEAPVEAADSLAALAGLWTALGAEQPVVVVLEDAHWAKGRTLDLMLRSLPETTPNGVVLVVVARSDETEALPLAWPRPADVVVDLGPLGDAAAEELAAHLLAGDELGAAGARAALLARAAGNPLFLRELVRTSRERPGDLRAAAIPPTVEALLSSRLERLPPLARLVAERAAVVGLSFTDRAVAALLGPERPRAAEGLEQLQRLGLVRRADPVLPGEGYAFAHALYAESAYRGLLRATRAELHQALADWLETAAADRLAGHRERLGHHLERAVLERRALGRHDAETDRTAMRGARWLGDAGRRALARDDAPAAADLLARARDLLPVDAHERAELTLRLGVARAELGDLAGADGLLRERLGVRRRGHAHLLYADGDGRDRVHDLGVSEVTIGRDADNGLALAWDQEVSRHHARLLREQEVWVLVDDGTSRNGSYVNGRPLVHRRALVDGDVLRFGETHVVFRAPGERPRTPPRPSATTVLSRDKLRGEA